MDKDIKILIIPDVHGRQFWKEPVKEVLEATDAQIVFLGDYLSPYPYEWESDIDYNRISIERFKEILELKRNNPLRITLLLGNHDATYAIGEDMCSCRMDRFNKKEIETLFEENHDLFQLAYEYNINEKKIIFSHAGILKGWVKSVWGNESEKDNFNVVDELNKAWSEENYGSLDALGDYDRYRGWGGMKYGSPIWSDIQSWFNVKPEETYGFNIVGHSQLKDEPIMFDTIVDLDCRKAFYLNSNGDIFDYETNEKIEKTKRP